MFAGALNKGFRGALPFLIAFFVLGGLFSFFAAKGLENNNYPNLFYNYFAQKVESRFLIVSLNYIFIGLGVFLISLIGIEQEVVEKQNYFPVFIYLIICLSAIQPHQITPQIFTNVFILYSIYKLLDTYRKEEVLNNIFVGAFWLSISAYITVSSIICFPLFFIMLLILRPFNWREWVVALLGFIAPVFIIECISYLSNFNQLYFIKAVQLYFNSLKMPTFSEFYLPMIFFLLLLLIISILSGLVGGFGNTVKKQRTKIILFWFIFLASLGFFSDGANSSRILLTYAFPVSLFIGDFLFSIKQIKITNTLLVLLFLCMVFIFLGQYMVI